MGAAFFQEPPHPGVQNGTCSSQLLRLPLRITRKTHSCVFGEKRVNMYILNGNRFLTFVTLSFVTAYAHKWRISSEFGSFGSAIGHHREVDMNCRS